MTTTDTHPLEADPSISPDPKRSRVARLLPGMDRFSGLYVFAVIMIAFSILTPETFLTARTFQAILSQEAITAILALALLVPLIAGVFDLSTATMLGFAMVLVCKLQSDGMNFWLAIILTLVAGALVGAVNAYIVVKLGVNSFIATLGTASVLGGMIYWVSGGQQITTGISPEFKALGQNTLFGLSLPVYYMAFIALVIWFVSEYRPVGRKLYATGGNPTGARLSGIPTSRLVAGTLVYSGVVSAFAGIAFAAQIGSASLTAGTGFLLPAFAAVFLGATQVKNGRANVLGTLIAVFVLATGVKGLLLLGASFWVSDIFNGVSLVVAVALSIRQGKSLTSGIG